MWLILRLIKYVITFEFVKKAYDFQKNNLSLFESLVPNIGSG